MSEQPQPVAGAAASETKARTSFGILGAISLSHLLNDMIQSLILAIYSLLQSEFSLTFMQIGMITLTFQLASSLLQPVVGYWTDKYPMPWSLPIGMCFTSSVWCCLRWRAVFGAVLLAAALVGTGSSVFHPESSRVARMASGRRHGLAQSTLSGQQQLWRFPGTLAGGGDYRALWQRQRCLVCACGTAGDRGVGANQPLVLGTAPNE
ncbi:MFS transporter [Escherichia coli]